MDRLPSWMLVGVTLACGGPAPADTDADTDIDTVEPSVWPTLDREGRIAYMTDTVVPAAQALFDSTYPNRPIVECTTCHGPDPVALDYQMPHDGLRALYPGDFPWPESFNDEEQEAYALFKRDVLVVGLAPLFGEPVIDYDDPTGPGFGCFACHPITDEPDQGSDDDL